MSKYHELQVLGKFWTQRVADVNNVSITDIDKARVAYSHADQQLYYCTGVNWEKFNGKYDVIPQNTKILMGAFPLPTGWNLVAGFSDKCCIITSTENQIGASGGSWSITGLQGAGAHDHSGYLGPPVGPLNRFGTRDTYGRTANATHTHKVLGTPGVNDGIHFHFYTPGWRPYNDKYCVAQYA